MNKSYEAEMAARAKAVNANRSERHTKDVLDALRAGVAEADGYPVGTHDGCVVLLAKLATLCEQAAAEVEHLQGVICEASNAAFDAYFGDIEHSIECHADTLHLVARDLAKGVDRVKELTSPIVNEIVGG